MRALCWNGVNDLRVETVPDPKIVNPHDAILKVRLSTTCGSDLHFIDGYIPTMREGDVIGHEFMGEIVEVGPEVREVKIGDRVVVPSFIGCGQLLVLRARPLLAVRQHAPQARAAEPVLGYPTGGIYGYTHAFGGYAGSHAEYIRVPLADDNCFHVPEGVPDEQALFLSDAVPTGYMGADFCDIKPGDTIAVWGCGGVGLMAQQSACCMGAERVIAIDRLPERLALARERIGSETIDYTEVDSVVETLREMTGGRGPDACIEAVGMEAHGTGLQYAYDRVKQALHLQTDRGERAARGGHGLPQGRDPLGPRRLRRDGQVPDRRAHEQGHHGAHRPAARAALHAAAARARPERRARPVLPATHRFSLEDGPARLRDVQEQGGRLRAGGVHAMSQDQHTIQDPTEQHPDSLPAEQIEHPGIEINCSSLAHSVLQSR